MKTVSKNTVLLFFKILLLFSVLVLLVATWILGQFPTDKEIKGCLVTKMYQVHLCPNSGHYVRLGDISPYVLKAVVLSEDDSFWQHNGFNLQELEKSIKANVEKGRYVRGGSTISQQLTKNLFLSKEKSLTRKSIEALITIRMERVLTKREILEKYLNVVQFGKGLFGIKAAAQFYFQKAPSQLTVVESAFLAFLLPSPEKYSKSFFKKDLTPFARNRLEQIIDYLFQFHRISDEEHLNAKAELSSFLRASVGTPASPTATESTTTTEEPAWDKIDEESAETEDN